MSNVFYAVFGTCRRRGGTKKKCYIMAVETIEKKTKRHKKKSKKRTKKRSRR